MLDYEGNEYNYSTLAELCEEWEDYSSTDESYRLNYVQCTCPKCKKKIILMVYSRVPFLRVEVADICGDVEENEPPRYK